MQLFGAFDVIFSRLQLENAPKPVYNTIGDRAKPVFRKTKEALIKSDVQITPSDFSSDCAKAAQESCRISSDFCAIWREICK